MYRNSWPLLALATFGILVAGPAIVGYIPIMVVGALIFLLGFELLLEALYETWGRLHGLEYLTVVIIVVTMGAWDFVVGILVGILLACVSFVVQTSRKTAIKATFTGQVATSTVRRAPMQLKYLRDAGQQTFVIKLAGYLFFGKSSLGGQESQVGLVEFGRVQAAQVRLKPGADSFNFGRAGGRLRRAVHYHPDTRSWRGLKNDGRTA